MDDNDKCRAAYITTAPSQAQAAQPPLVHFRILPPTCRRAESADAYDIQLGFPKLSPYLFNLFLSLRLVYFVLSLFRVIQIACFTLSPSGELRWGRGRDRLQPGLRQLRRPSGMFDPK